MSEAVRIAITGLGLVCPLGCDVATAWQGLLAGESGLREVTAFDTSGLEVHRAGEVPDFHPEAVLSDEQLRRCGRASQMAIAASHQALDDAALPLEQLDPRRVGVSFGTTMGEPGVFDRILDRSVAEGWSQVEASWWRQLPGHSIPNNIAARFGLRGPNHLLPTACAAGNYAIGYASDLLRLGKVDAMLAGGADALSRIAFVGFHKLRAMSADVVSPFDLHRKGMMIGEGAGALVLERMDDALARGATIYAELLGYGLGCDAHKMSIPHPEGLGGIRALREALRRAGIQPHDVDHISAHGTGTQENDRIETQIIRAVLGPHADRCPVNSIKSMLGHCMGASSAIEAVVCALTLTHGLIPPTAHYETPDPECDLDYVPNQARAMQVEIAVSHAYAFGGNTSALVLKAFGGAP